MPEASIPRNEGVPGFQGDRLQFACVLRAVTVCVIVLAYVLKRMLDKVETEWVEGKAELMHEKQQFSSLVEAMYPPAVAHKLLNGEHQIVFGVQKATVFFSDIHEFTSLSNSINSDQLIQFLGYTFGVMDSIAEYTGVYKIKTIGDAYLAITGLPGSHSSSPCFDMMTFASYCAQIFSDRYSHPNQGSILRLIAEKTLMRGDKKKARLQSSGGQSRAESIVSSGSARSRVSRVSGAAPVDLKKNSWTSLRERGIQPHDMATCVMRYGIATGPVTAGVLQGKAPMFDIWGQTVNLASRLESTSQSGRIQVHPPPPCSPYAVALQPRWSSNAACDETRCCICMQGDKAVKGAIVRASLRMNGMGEVDKQRCKGRDKFQGREEGG